MLPAREGPGVLVGLYYYRYRYYDPEAGRFISRDPLGMWGDPGQRGNAQNYCGNNPVNRVDALGLDGSGQAPHVDPPAEVRPAEPRGEVKAPTRSTTPRTRVEVRPGPSVGGWSMLGRAFRLLSTRIALPLAAAEGAFTAFQVPGAYSEFRQSMDKLNENLDHARDVQNKAEKAQQEREDDDKKNAVHWVGYTWVNRKEHRHIKIFLMHRNEAGGLVREYFHRSWAKETWKKHGKFLNSAAPDDLYGSGVYHTTFKRARSPEERYALAPVSKSEFLRLRTVLETWVKASKKIKFGYNVNCVTEPKMFAQAAWPRRAGPGPVNARTVADFERWIENSSIFSGPGATLR